MPTYCYKCFDCNYYEEVKQSINDEPLKTCPKCKSHNYRRVIRSVGIIFKGSGFHITDYRDSKKSTLKPSQEKGGEKKPTESKESKSKDNAA